MEPLVSICIPTYNGAKHLRECLDSVLAQTFTDFEVVLVDDCSSDNTVAIAQEYARCDKRMRVEQNQHNLGLVNNWNRCVELAKGEWIKFVFQDDLIIQECLEKLLKGAGAETSIVCCRRNFCFEERVQQKVRDFYLELLSLDTLFPRTTRISSEEFCNAALGHYDTNFIGEPTSVMLRKNVFFQFGKFNPHLIIFCDYEFWVRVASNTGLSYVPETLATFRVHNRAVSALNREKKSFRMNILDRLIMLHEFVLNPLYEPIRVAASKHKPPVDLLNLLAYKTREAFRLTLGRNEEQNDSSNQRMEDWKDVVQYYPALGMFSKKFFIHSKRLKVVMKALKLE